MGTALKAAVVACAVMAAAVLLVHSAVWHDSRAIPAAMSVPAAQPCLQPVPSATLAACGPAHGDRPGPAHPHGHLGRNRIATTRACQSRPLPVTADAQLGDPPGWTSGAGGTFRHPAVWAATEDAGRTQARLQVLRR